MTESVIETWDQATMLQKIALFVILFLAVSFAFGIALSLVRLFTLAAITIVLFVSLRYVVQRIC